MTRTLLATLLLTAWSASAFAEKCPTVDDIKHNRLRGWQLHDTDDGPVNSAKRIADYRAQIKQFALAEWENVNNKENLMHCYYLDADGSNLNAFLAKKDFHPLDETKFWYTVTGSLQCTAGMDKCQFKSLASSERHLAAKKTLKLKG